MKTFKQLKKEKNDRKTEKANKKIKKVKPPKALKPATHREMIERSTLIKGNLKFGDTPIACRHAEDFKTLAIQHLSETAAVLAFCFGVKTKVLQFTASGELELVNGFVSAKDQYVNAVHAFNGEPELARIIVGWCVLAALGWHKLLTDEQRTICSNEFIEYVCTKGWKAAFVTNHQLKQFEVLSREYWARRARFTPQESKRFGEQETAWSRLGHKGYHDDRPVDPRSQVNAWVRAPLHPSMAHFTLHENIAFRSDDICLYLPSRIATMRYGDHTYQISSAELIEVPQGDTFSYKVQSQGHPVTFRGCQYGIYSQNGDTSRTVLRPLSVSVPKSFFENIENNIDTVRQDRYTGHIKSEHQPNTQN